MKQIIAVLALGFLINSCDDGDLTFEKIDFDAVTANTCGNKLYKLNEKEALILSIGTVQSQFDSFFTENPTPVGSPALIPIPSTTPETIVKYRLYDGEVSTASICDAIAPLNPTAIEDWTAASGTMQITTTANIAENTTTGFEGGQKITGYRHNIIFNNILFDKSSGTSQLYETFNFGSFDKAIMNALPRTFDQELEKCDSQAVVFNIAGNHALLLYIDPALINGSVLNATQSAEINSSTNSLFYLIYEQGNLSGESYFCTATPIANPLQTWTATGVIDVTSTQVGSSLEHTIVLKNVTLSRDNNAFILATNFSFGTLITQ